MRRVLARAGELGAGAMADHYDGPEEEELEENEYVEDVDDDEESLYEPIQCGQDNEEEEYVGDLDDDDENEDQHEDQEDKAVQFK